MSNAQTVEMYILAEFLDRIERAEKERDEARNALSLIAEDCEAWLASEADEPSSEFIKLVANYAKEASK